MNNVGHYRTPLTIEEKLLKLTLNTNYTVIQTNGQRIFGPASSAGLKPPPRGTEIFVGNLPSNLFEDELISLFSSIGALYNVRMMLDFSGKSRGYAFVTFFMEEHAHQAVKCFNGTGVRNSKTKISVSLSVDNRRLFIGNVPRDRTDTDLKSVLESYVEGVIDVIIYAEPNNPTINRGFAFVEFETHRMAAIARRQLTPGNVEVWGQVLFVDWAEPLPLINPLVLKQVKILYLSNIPCSMPSGLLNKVIKQLLNMNDRITKIFKSNHYAFVHCRNRHSAEEAMEKLSGLVLHGHHISVEWARPLEYSKTNRAQKPPDNFCKSVPPHLRKEAQQRRDLFTKSKKYPASSYASSCASLISSSPLGIL